MRRDTLRWPLVRRRVRKLLRSLRAHVIHNYSRARMSFLLAAFVLLGLFLYPSNAGSGSTSNPLVADPDSSIYLHHQSRQKSIEEEQALAANLVCERTILNNNVEELRICGFEASSAPKLVGLVEVRNAESSITPFLSALAQVVDSIVIIDDHSSDRSRTEILQYSAVDMKGKPVVEVLLNKTGEWVREELFDRELLLSTGRKIGGTHFILLDYDEYLSVNCVENGLLRKTILELRPGESLNLPWIEIWKSHTLQRVLPNDPQMNFLKRRQTVIFADDGTSHYTQETATARLLGSHPRNSTIHVLRCPRTICPKPPKYSGRYSKVANDDRVKALPQCAILEMRFLSINNMLLKSAWYEALGRVTGAEEGATSGKMVNLLFPATDNSSETECRLESVDPKLVGKHALDGAKSLGQVELWRAKELLEWISLRGRSSFANLRSLSLIDVDELRNVVHQACFNPSNETFHVPRRKNGIVVVVYESSITDLLRKLLSQTGFSEIDLGSMTERYPQGVRLETFGANSLQYEFWKTKVRSTILGVLQKTKFKGAFMILPEQLDFLFVSLVDVLHREMADTHIVLLTTTPRALLKEDEMAKIARTVSRRRGSHVQLIIVPVTNFGSYSAMQWLTKRLRTTDTVANNHTDAESLSILDFVETVQRDALAGRPDSVARIYAPVGKLIFSLNFGRSGSKYLADVIGKSRGLVSSQHEVPCPEGRCSGGGALRMQNKSLESSYEERKSLKLPMIRRTIAGLYANVTSMFESRTVSCDALYGFIDKEDRHNDAGENQRRLRPIYEITSNAGCVIHFLPDVVYAETNPNFKSWIYDIALDVFPKSGYDVRVVVLRKYVAALLKSLYETGYFTVRDGYNWMETAAGVNSKVKVKLLQNDNELDGFGKILSYLITSEAVFRHVIQKYGSEMGTPRFLEMRSERLYTAEGTMQLLEWLGVEPSDETIILAGTVRDKYVEGTSRRRKTVSLAECDRRVNSFLESIRDKDEARIVRDLLQSLDREEGYEYPP